MIPHAFFRECDLVGSLLDPVRDAVIILQRFQRFITCENRHFPVYITLIDDLVQLVIDPVCRPFHSEIINDQDICGAEFIQQTALTVFRVPPPCILDFLQDGQ